MHCFGPVIAEPDEPVFHARWEGQVRVIMGRTVGRYYNLDEFRHAIERMPPDEYLQSSYYEKWLHAVQTLLLEKGVITAEEFSNGHALQQAPPPSAPVEEAPVLRARFRPGDRVVTRNTHPTGHTRLPRYARDKRGQIRTVNGPFLLPDANAHGRKEWQACYAVEFSARELWGADAQADDRVCIDLWEGYLDPEEQA